MAQISFNADFKIRVVLPLVTKPLGSEQRQRVGASGAFPYQPRPQIETKASLTRDLGELPSAEERSEKLKTRFNNMLIDLEKIRKAIRKRAKNIAFEYDPLLTKNEAYADAEETLFGFASGVITYDQYEQLLEFEKKLDAWIRHASIANGGALNVGA